MEESATNASAEKPHTTADDTDRMEVQSTEMKVSAPTKMLEAEDESATAVCNSNCMEQVVSGDTVDTSRIEGFSDLSIKQDLTPSYGQSSEELNRLRVNMLARVAVSDAHFKHQQRGEPDLTMEEKIEIAQAVLDANKVTFLARFGPFLDAEDVEYFKDSRDVYEIDFYIKQILKSKTGAYHKNQVKNRRYEAMKRLVSEGEYFSEEEMKFRDPYLYDQMVGQYLTDDEIKAKVDKSDLRFSSILLSHIDQLEENSRFSRSKDKEEGQEEEEEEEEEEESDESEMEEEGPAVDDCGGEPRKTVSDEQKKRLKEEFATLMQEKFLSGHDYGFDYSNVDDNEEYDDLDVLNKDEEEKYFADDG